MKLAMTFEDFLASLSRQRPPTGLSAPLLALWHEAQDDWKQAHEIVQGEDCAEAAWVHAYLHRKEGDLANAGYWYRRVKRPVSTEALENEWRSIATDLIALERTD